MYEKSTWGRDADGNRVLVPVVAWDIGMLMTRHHEDCRVRAELRRSVHTGESQERRLELALSTACTCGARAHENNTAPIDVKIGDRRDNRDPAQVGEEWLSRNDK